MAPSMNGTTTPCRDHSTRISTPPPASVFQLGYRPRRSCKDHHRDRFLIKEVGLVKGLLLGAHRRPQPVHLCFPVFPPCLPSPAGYDRLSPRLRSSTDHPVPAV